MAIQQSHCAVIRVALLCYGIIITSVQQRWIAVTGLSLVL
ncbi:hypothetical protein BRADI_5g02450v3 [Brachypodium distachyon]|uniref:Uncharacterized protein n=1 Tax=Brachypodium distachyon TaxID=15368 RepID=A0A2K2CF21_BRADI|nr:hypothetical protein BRADI_5g02450v3 [Brachypodium distachyon]